MKVKSKQFPKQEKEVTWSLWFNKTDKIITGTYALCVWKRKMMMKEGHGKNKFEIKHELTTTVKP